MTIALDSIQSLDLGHVVILWQCPGGRHDGDGHARFENEKSEAFLLSKSRFMRELAIARIWELGKEGPSTDGCWLSASWSVTWFAFLSFFGFCFCVWDGIPDAE